uniref:Uncharacterized protein n=1 Tax=Rhizophora mucronata TaxID=61149 RepID=A0A2P2NFL1_RHIMU
MNIQTLYLWKHLQKFHPKECCTLLVFLVAPHPRQPATQYPLPLPLESRNGSALSQG